MTKRIGPVTLDSDTAASITVLTLKEYRGYLKSDLAAWKKNPRTVDNPEGVWMHPEDVTETTLTIASLNQVLRHYGG